MWHSHLSNPEPFTLAPKGDPPGTLHGAWSVGWVSDKPRSHNVRGCDTITNLLKLNQKQGRTPHQTRCLEIQQCIRLLGFKMAAFFFTIFGDFTLTEHEVWLPVTWSGRVLHTVGICSVDSLGLSWFQHRWKSMYCGINLWFPTMPQSSHQYTPWVARCA